MGTSIYFLLLITVSSAFAAKNVRDVMDSILKGYDKRSRPNEDLGKPVNVRIEAAILDIYNFDELKHQVTMTVYFRQKWNDPRLAFNPVEVRGANLYRFSINEVNQLWLPDTFIANERSVIQHNFSHLNQFTRVESNGNVTRSVKITVTIGCILNLRFFPFDQNVCSMDFESYGYTTSDVDYDWARDSNGKPIIWVSKEAYQGVRHDVTATRGTVLYANLATGNYSRVSLELQFKRLSFRYLLEVYFPSTAIPIVAFITLCVGTLEFRVLLSTICMFMMVTYAIIFRLGHVQVDYKTALDFYVFNSSVTVFNIVLVNFFMYYLLKPKPAPTQLRMRQLNGSRDEGKGILADEESTTEDLNGTSSTTPGTAPRFPNKTMELFYKFIEKSYVTMPIFFLIFNIIYWPVVLIASSGTPEDFIPVESRGS